MAAPEIDAFADEGQVSATRLWTTRILIALLLLALLVGIGYGIKKMFSGGATHKKQITTVKLLPDTPPPPPPPPPKEPPKETPKEQPKEAPKEPVAKPAETPPAENLKMEGAAGDGPSPFQSGAVNNEYKGGDVTTGPKIGGRKNMAAFAWFTNKVDAQIKKALDAEDGLNKIKYQVDVRVFLNAQGDIDHAELIDSTGDTETDALIRKVLNRIPPLKESAPEDMPRKVVVRMASKNMS
ncbi:TonB C-terminal domain-containing protein [Methylophilus medardicus]|uniref:TonB C-terminal domain-containing protein n=1 Tax=Methylophilus medardicus TaxID=2588534 RepID=A0A5B8CTN6_9PROT|nr:TonB C-terminal domain-containing protein [Methylophilus medardicus]QDC44677.1 TonB C-terminal domain-containing protein [Methylophilus medardicus]QDC49684.1 TonB C-terminal domain-containing protein [Methylophilus medardicus]QDC53389.1 TonB C-terminal domain-containing protein [Methylophilus medardicus]